MGGVVFCTPNCSRVLESVCLAVMLFINTGVFMCCLLPDARIGGGKISGSGPTVMLHNGIVVGFVMVGGFVYAGSWIAMWVATWVDTWNQVASFKKYVRGFGVVIPGALMFVPGWCLSHLNNNDYWRGGIAFGGAAGVT